MTYYLYHIPGKKIGVTCDLNNRVTKQQGYTPDEYEVLEISKDVDYISDRELELQREYGYRVDRKLYKNLKPKTKMKINITEQTTTFPCPINKLKGQLMDEIGMKWVTEHGEISITETTIPWIMKNIKTSMYNHERCFIYNKAFAKYYTKNSSWSNTSIDERAAFHFKNEMSIFRLIREWASVRGLYAKGDPMTQFVKLQEECGELAKALLKRDEPEVVDAIGDIVVVLTNLAHIKGYKIEDCVESAYKVINKRTGKMVNGTFVKDE
jgi:NTP pyrophosphatase (non-canonical NTP hydrolase)